MEPSSSEGFVRQFTCSRPVWIGPDVFSLSTHVHVGGGEFAGSLAVTVLEGLALGTLERLWSSYRAGSSRPRRRTPRVPVITYNGASGRSKQLPKTQKG